MRPPGRRRRIAFSCALLLASACDHRSDLVAARFVRVRVSPHTTTIQVGEQRQITATIEPRFSPIFRSSDTTIAIVSARGLVTGRGIGTARITAAIGVVSDVATITVTAPPPPLTAADSGILARHDFDDGTLGPFTDPWGEDLDVVEDPTGSGRGKVVRVRYADSSGDRNRGFFYTMPDGIGMGDSIFFRGDVFLAVDSLEGGMRKLVYWHRDNPTTFPEFSSVLALFGSHLEVHHVVLPQTGPARIDVTRSVATIEGGRWYTLEAQTTLNSSFVARDGASRIWLDGVLVYERLDLSWSDPEWTASPADQRLRSFGVGYQMQSGAAFDEQRYWDNVTFSRSRLPR